MIQLTVKIVKFYFKNLTSVCLINLPNGFTLEKFKIFLTC